MFTMYWFGGYSVLVFVGALCLTVFLLLRAAVIGVRGRRAGALRSLRWLAGLVALYALGLCVVATAMPRRFVGAGDRECFDDWCVGGLVAKRTAPGVACAAHAGEQAWTVAVRMSSRARRGVQRARDAEALLEDRQGRVYQPCVRGALQGAIASGERRDTSVMFSLPADAAPAGLVVSHGAFPDALIIGADQSVLHRRTLLAVSIDSAT